MNETANVLRVCVELMCRRVKVRFAAARVLVLRSTRSLFPAHEESRKCSTRFRLGPIRRGIMLLRYHVILGVFRVERLERG